MHMQVLVFSDYQTGCFDDQVLLAVEALASAVLRIMKNVILEDAKGFEDNQTGPASPHVRAELRNQSGGGLHIVM